MLPGIPPREDLSLLAAKCLFFEGGSIRRGMRG